MTGACRDGGKESNSPTILTDLFQIDTSLAGAVSGDRCCDPSWIRCDRFDGPHLDKHRAPPVRGTSRPTWELLRPRESCRKFFQPGGKVPVLGTADRPGPDPQARSRRTGADRLPRCSQRRGARLCVRYRSGRRRPRVSGRARPRRLRGRSERIGPKHGGLIHACGRGCCGTEPVDCSRA